MLAHISDDGLTRQQTVLEHTKGVADLCEAKASSLGIGNIVKMCAVYHDIGKEKKRFQDYICADQKEQRRLRGKIEHSSSGARYIYEKYGNSKGGIDRVLTDLVSYAIASHHGIFDNITEEGNSYWLERLQRAQDFDEVCQNAQKDILACYDVDQIWNIAREEMQCVIKKLREISQSNGKEFYFYLSCMQRLILSVLIDSDWEDTAGFMMNVDTSQKKGITLTTDEIFEEAAVSFSAYMKGLSKKFESRQHSDNEKEVYDMRNQIQKECVEFSKYSEGIYCLPIPTGGGKTLSSLAYALTYARAHSKTKRIVYVAPYISVIEQNADVIRKAIGNEKWILEHHSNVIREEETQDGDDSSLWDINWEEPFVCTTFVQFMNSLFSDKKQAIRRMNKLANSVIIIDEVQAMPIKCIYTFNSMMNFLNKMCGANIILCTATQPQLANSKLEHKIHYSMPANMIKNIDTKFEKFDRVDIISMKGKGEISFEQLAEDVLKKSDKYNSILVVLNTKSAVRNLYELISSMIESTTDVYYLTTNLCAEHRGEYIDAIKQACKEKERKCIVISTNLIEAGVDISFECVFRSIAGLDSIAQSAGRCNRNGELERGTLYIVNVEGENRGRMEELTEAINSTKRVQYMNEGKSNLLNPGSMEQFYNYYYLPQKQREKMKFSVKNLDNNIYDLLSTGFLPKDERNGGHLNNAAYKTAGKNYEIIEPNNIGVIVPYKRGAEIINCLQQAIDYGEVKRLIRYAQRYTINVPNSKLKQYIEQGVIYPCSDRFPEIYVVSPGGYNNETGFTGEIENMFF